MKKWNFRVIRACTYITSLCAVTATLCDRNRGIGNEKVALEGFSVGVVGREVITHQDVLDRLAMETKFFRRTISDQNYAKLYKQAAHALVNEARQRQAPGRLVSMAKKAHQTQAITPLLPAEITKEVDERIATMAKSNSMTIAEFQTFLGVHYRTFYRRQEAMVSFQRFLMVKWGSRAMRNIMSSAITKARKKWKDLQGAAQYRLSEIVIYNRGEGRFAQDQISEIASLINTGEPFSELANRFSESRTSERNGDCGWRILGFFDRPIQDFLKTAAIGDISPVIGLPTGKNPEKWVLLLLMDQRSGGKSMPDAVTEKDPGDEVFRSNLFALELERLSKAEMDDLSKSFPCTLNIQEKMALPNEAADVLDSGVED